MADGDRVRADLRGRLRAAPVKMNEQNPDEADMLRALLGAALVVGTLLVLAVVLIPTILRPHHYPLESTAEANLRAIMGAQVTFHQVNRRYATSFEELTEPVPSFLEGNWNGIKQGWVFTLRGDGQGYEVTATPVGRYMDDSRHFYANETGVIRWSREGPPDENSPPLNAYIDPDVPFGPADEVPGPAE